MSDTLRRVFRSEAFGLAVIYSIGAGLAVALVARLEPEGFGQVAAILFGLPVALGLATLEDRR